MWTFTCESDTIFFLMNQCLKFYAVYPTLQCSLNNTTHMQIIDLQSILISILAPVFLYYIRLKVHNVFPKVTFPFNLSPASR